MYTIGIDLGTSSVKAAAVCDGGIKTVRAFYPEKLERSPEGWLTAVNEAVKALDVPAEEVSGLGLTTQVGTYILYKEGERNLPVYGWSDGGGESQLDALSFARDRDFYVRNTSIPLQKLISYPLVKIKWLSEERPRQWEKCEKLLAPKDYLYYKLTGKLFSDIYSWNGLDRHPDGVITDEILSLAGTTRERFPSLASPFDAPGSLTEEAAKAMNLKAGTKVFLGCNDSHASFAGMGITKTGQAFDLTGTSEHIGFISDKLTDDRSVSTPFFEGYANMGISASSGTAIDWGFSMFGKKNVLPVYSAVLNGEAKPPVFLPYLSGERSPIWDSDARGVFFGLSANTSSDEMLYSVLEGVAFCACHMWDTLGGTAKTLRLGGGAAESELLNRIKSDLLGVTLERPKEKNTGALGAALIACTGNGEFSSLTEACERYITIEETVYPEIITTALRRRYDVYRSLYPKLRGMFEKI